MIFDGRDFFGQANDFIILPSFALASRHASAPNDPRSAGPTLHGGPYQAPSAQFSLPKHTLARTLHRCQTLLSPLYLVKGIEPAFHLSRIVVLFLREDLSRETS